MSVHTKLAICYTLIAIVCVLRIGQFSGDPIYSDSSRGAGRNESSTPRTFVLPATPAVALQQERLALLMQKEGVVKLCMLSLLDAGYSIGNIEAIDNMETVVSLIVFQRQNQLSVTGEFDPPTMALLGC